MTGPIPGSPKVAPKQSTSNPHVDASALDEEKVFTFKSGHLDKLKQNLLSSASKDVKKAKRVAVVDGDTGDPDERFRNRQSFAVKDRTIDKRLVGNIKSKYAAGKQQDPNKKPAPRVRSETGTSGHAADT